MSIEKEECGKSMPPNEAIINLIVQIVKNTPGVYDFSTRFYDEVVDGISGTFGGKQRHPGITLKQSKEGLQINLYLIVHSVPLVALAKEIQKTIVDRMKQEYHAYVHRVNIKIESVYVEEGMTHERNKKT